jgi:hypothetical protein
MKYLKMLALAALAAMALMAMVGAGTASATTLEVGGVTRNESVTLTLSLASGTSLITEDTSGVFQNTCTASHVHKHTTQFTNPVTGPATTMTYSACSRTITVHAPGKTEIVWTSGTNGTVYSEETELTTGSPFGTLTCRTGTTTHIGNLTGVAAGHATLHINAVIDCGISARWTGTYTVTSPTGLGVSP